MRAERPELLNYTEIRAATASSVLSRHVSRPTVVLGSSQGRDLLAPDVERSVDVRWRRGGGGAVLLRPADWWIDFWLVPTSPAYRSDPTAQAVVIGEWWREVLAPLVEELTVVTTPPATSAAACFAGLGAGEVVAAGKKLVGITQWRVREGALVSTVALAQDSTPLVDLLAAPTDDLTSALAHATLESLGVVSHRDAVVAQLARLPR